MSATAYLPDGSSVTVHAVPPGLCIPCGSVGYLLVPCGRSDPDRIVPECRTLAYLAHGRHGGCSALGCQHAVKRVPCYYCSPKEPAS